MSTESLSSSEKAAKSRFVLWKSWFILSWHLKRSRCTVFSSLLSLIITNLSPMFRWMGQWWPHLSHQPMELKSTIVANLLSWRHPSAWGCALTVTTMPTSPCQRPTKESSAACVVRSSMTHVEVVFCKMSFFLKWIKLMQSSCTTKRKAYTNDHSVVHPNVFACQEISMIIPRMTT